MFITNKIAQHILCDMSCVRLWDEVCEYRSALFPICYIRGSSHADLSKTSFGIYTLILQILGCKKPANS